MAYRLPKPPFKTDPVTGKIIGAVKIPDEELAAENKIEGDPEKTKAAMRAFGLGSMTGLVDDAVAGKNPLASKNISIPGANEIVGKQKGATTGDIGQVQNTKDNPQRQEQEFKRLILDDENILHHFASVNHLWSFGCLTPDEINDPDGTYRKFGGAAAPLTAIDATGRNLGRRTRTYAEKKYDVTVSYFIDNVQIQSVIAPNPKSRATNFFNITFEVREPYSMGQFLQTLQVCANAAGYSNYLKAPWLLSCQFKGYDTEGREVKEVGLKRLFPVSLVSVDFNVDAAGSVYNFTCSAYNDTAFEDTTQNLPVAMTISGQTLFQALSSGLNSLTTHFNTHLLRKKQESAGKEEVDEVMIVFPDLTSSADLKEAIAKSKQEDTATTGDLALKPFIDAGIDLAFERGGGDDAVGFEGKPPIAGSIQEQKRRFVEGRLGYSVVRGSLSESLKSVYTRSLQNSNYIGLQKILPEEELSAGNVPFGLANFTYNPENGLLEKGAITINPKVRTVTFEAGTKIQKVIEEMILLSEWGSQIFNRGTPDKEGMIPWFRIESSVYLIDDKLSEATYGRKPRIYVYKVVPYEVHQSQFQMPNTAPKGYDYLLKNAARKYNYIYTGQNRDILSFDLNFNNAFYEAIALDQGNRKGNTDASSGGSVRGTQQVKAEIQSSGNAVQGDGREIKRVNKPLQSEAAGALAETVPRQVARQFNEAIVNSSASLISIDMEILGDPYYLADSGVGNYNAEATESVNLNIDAGINYQSSEVDILIKFKSPIDINPDESNYSMAGEAIDMKDFSGLYKVNTVTSKFERNVFTQTLQCVRRRNYELLDQGNETDQKALERDGGQTKRIAEAKETGDPDLLRFAYADTDADGKLSEGERVAAGIPREEAIALARKASKELPVTTNAATVAESQNTPGTPAPATTTATTDEKPASNASGSLLRRNNDMYYNYGKQNR